MKVERTVFLKFNKDSDALIQGLDNYHKDVLQNISAKPIHAQKLYKDIIERLYNGYKVYENSEFEDSRLELEYLLDYITYYLDHIYSMGYDYRLKGENGLIFYSLDKNTTYKNSFINEYEKMILDVLRLIDRAEKLSKELNNSKYTLDIREKKKICHYELAQLYTFYKEVEIGIEHFKMAYNFGSEYSAANLVYIFTRDDYFDLDLAVEYYNKYKQTPGMLRDSRLLFCYAQSTMHLISVYEKLDKYDKIISLIKEYSRAMNIKIPDRENKDLLINYLSEHYTNAEEKLKELEENLAYFTDVYLRSEEKIKELEEKKTKEELITKHFSKDIISKMSNDIKIYAETSLRVYDYVNNLNNDGITLDYSATLMPIMKGVEQLLKIVVESYLNYLKKLFAENILTTKDFYKIDKYLLNDDRTNLKDAIADFLEIGKAYYALYKRNKPNIQNPESSSKNESYPRDTFVDFCESLKVDNAKEKLKKLGEILFKVKNYRNNIAHDVRIIKEDADTCFKMIIHDYINLINELYTIFGDILK